MSMMEMYDIHDIKDREVRVHLDDGTMIEGTVIFNGRSELLLKGSSDPILPKGILGDWKYVVINKEYIRYVEVR